MTYFRFASLFGLLGVLGAGVACQVTRPYAPPAAATQGLYRQPAPADTATLAAQPWRSLFADPPLQALIEEGLAHNLDLQIALTRVRQAEATTAQTQAAFLPSLSAGANATLAHQPTSPTATASPTGTGSSTADPTTVVAGLVSQQYLLSLSTSWEADVWGRLRSSRRAALAALQQSEAYRRVVQTQLIASLANQYYLLLALDAQLAITQRTVENRIQSVATMRVLKRGAVVTGAAVVQSEASRYAVEVTIPALERQIRETENTLSSLLGRPAGPIARGTLAAQAASPLLQAGVPSQLLRLRPDVQEAEAAYRADFEQANLARASFYPRLMLTAAGGFSTTALSALLQPATLFGNLVGGLAQPILSQGANRARLRRAEAQQQEDALVFQRTLLTAGQEVSNALYAYQAASRQAAVRARQQQALRTAVEYTEALLRYGTANYTEVLTAQQGLLAAELSGVNDRLLQLQAVTALYHALGGGGQ